MTNYEQIKNMSVEELAEIFNRNYKCNRCAFNSHPYICNANCLDGIKQYLESEVEDNER